MAHIVDEKVRGEDTERERERGRGEERELKEKEQTLPQRDTALRPLANQPNT